MSPEEAKRKYDEALSALTPELQEMFRALAANAKQRPRIESLTESELCRLDSEDVEIAVIDFVERQLAPSADRVTTILSMPRGLQVFYLSFVLEAEVMNGGFNQFFWNSSSEFAELMAAILRDLGASEAAALFEKAFAVANEELDTAPPHSRTLEAFSESYAHTRLNQFDEQFCKQALQFPDLRTEIIRTNQPTFFLGPHTGQPFNLENVTKPLQQ